MSERLADQERLKPNEAQEAKLRQLCDGFRVEYASYHYHVYPDDSWMMPGWCEGWIGGHDLQAERPTIYVGVSPEGEAHS
jgi:hypothetical protein